MKPSSALWGGCLVAATLLLGAALGLAPVGLLPGQALAGLLPAAGWLVGRRASRAWAAYAGLAVYLGLAGGAVLLGAPAWLLLAGSAVALAGWDLTLFAGQLDECAGASAARLERRHLAALLAALGLGIALAAGALAVRVHLPFGLTAAIAAAALTCLAALRK